MSSPPTSSVRIELAPDPSEMPALVSIFDIAIKASGDKFHEVLMRYAEDHYKETTKRLQAAQSTPVEDSPAERHFVLKAIETVPGYSSGDSHEHGRGNSGEMLEEKAMEEKIVGMAHWTIGYINLSKADPFEQQIVASAALATTENESAEVRALEEPISMSAETGAASNPGSDPEPFDFYAVCRKPVRNTYISQIRGKKHVCKSCPCHNPSSRYLFFRALSVPFSTLQHYPPSVVLSHSTDLRRIAVHPDYQGRGIARQLLQWGLDRADSEKLVSYLNGRPQARRLYENGGFKVVNIVPMPVPGLEVSDMIVMVRQPQSVKGR
jgi:GNAT superfamily N-acetyltransferase